MKRLFIIIGMAVASLGGFAQADSTDVNISTPATHTWHGDYRYGTFGPWLHQGLNVNLDLSAFATFGKHARHGGGFGQSISATWLQPVNDKLWVAAGGRFNNIIYGGDSYRDGSLYLMAGYRFNERWEAYVYAEKNMINNHAPRLRYGGYGYYGPDMLLYDFGPSPLGRGMGAYPYGIMPADRIGAAVRYNFSPTFSMEVSVEGVWPKYDRVVTHPYQYNYPIRENY